MKWLAECSAEALGEALRVVAPELSGCPVTVPGPVGKQDPLWHSGSVPVGDGFFVKFGQASGQNLAVTSDTELIVSSPQAANSGPVDVTVTTPAGISTAAHFTYLPSM
jgi:hypothetical protein